MRFGTRLYGTDPEAIVAKAERAEALGFESLWRGDHLVLPGAVRSEYPYSKDGSSPFPPSTPLLDVLLVLAYVARATARVRLATGVYLLPLRDPFAAARSVQTLDVLSGGRVIFGVGVGWLEEEFRLLGRDYRARGAITDEAIQVLKTLWTQPEPAFEGRHFRFGDARFEPKPVQRPHPPVVVGGESPAALRRAASAGDGWYGHCTTPEEAARRVEQLHRLRSEAGRGEVPFEVTVRVDPQVASDDVRRFEDAGVTRLVAEIGSIRDTAGRRDVDLLEDFAERVIAPLR